MIPVVTVLCYHQLFGLSGVDVLLVFFHMFSMDWAVSLIWTLPHQWGILSTSGIISPRISFTGQRKLAVFLGSKSALLTLCLGTILPLLTC
jgi:hypothetical protein